MGSLAERLIQLRGERSRRAFANQLGVKESSLRNYEKGTSEPDAQIIRDICQKLRISANWLVLGEEGELAGDSKEMSEAVVSGGECKRCLKLEAELEAERSERRNLATENRDLYKKCIEQERIIGELKLALQTAQGERQTSPIGADDFVPHAHSDIPFNRT